MSKDPCGHVRLSVQNLEASIAFYDQLFIRISAERIAQKGWATREGLGVWLIQAEEMYPPYTFGAPGLHHLCFKAQSEEEVNILYDFLVESGVIITAPPRRYLQYTEEYYAVFFLDPDRMQMEVAHY